MGGGNHKIKEGVCGYSVQPLPMTHPRSCWNGISTSIFEKHSIKSSTQVANWDREPVGVGLSVNLSLWREGITVYQRQHKNVFLMVYSGNCQQKECFPHGKGWNDGLCKAWHFLLVTEIVLECVGWEFQEVDKKNFNTTSDQSPPISYPVSEIIQP